MAVNFSGISRDGFPGRLLRLPLKLLPASLVVRVLQGPLRGRRWIVGSATHGCWLGSYELAKQKLFSSLLKSGETVYDIGANVGVYTLIAAARAGTDGRVHAFEPLPENIRYLRRHLDLNAVKNVTVHECAVSDRTGTACFSVHGSRMQGALVPEGQLEVETITLDECGRKFSQPSALKIDVEGAEMLVLRGGAETIARARPVILLATHGAEAHAQCCRFLESMDYSIRAVDGTDPLSSNELLAKPL